MCVSAVRPLACHNIQKVWIVLLLLLIQFFTESVKQNALPTFCQSSGVAATEAYNETRKKNVIAIWKWWKRIEYKICGAYMYLKIVSNALSSTLCWPNRKKHKNIEHRTKTSNICTFLLPPSNQSTDQPVTRPHTHPSIHPLLSTTLYLHTWYFALLCCLSTTTIMHTAIRILPTLTSVVFFHLFAPTNSVDSSCFVPLPILCVFPMRRQEIIYLYSRR